MAVANFLTGRLQVEYKTQTRGWQVFLKTTKVEREAATAKRFAIAEFEIYEAETVEAAIALAKEANGPGLYFAVQLGALHE